MTNIIDLSAALRDELAANDEQSVSDPRDVPGRFSTLKQFEQSPLHYLHAVRSGYDETLSMRLGSGAHAISFGQPYVVWNGKVRNGKVWDAFEAKHAGELILNLSELDKAKRMAAALREHPVASRLLFGPGTLHESRIDWTWRGRAFRSTPDACTHTTLIDLKCLRSAEPDKVMWQSSKMFYHAQSWLYTKALNSIGRDIKEQFLVVVENKEPFPVSVFRFTPMALDRGMRACERWFEQMLHCEERGVYPGYSTTVVDLDVPGGSIDDFVFAEDEEQADGL